jgi:hypothetical protein
MARSVGAEAILRKNTACFAALARTPWRNFLPLPAEGGVQYRTWLAKFIRGVSPAAANSCDSRTRHDTRRSILRCLFVRPCLS